MTENYLAFRTMVEVILFLSVVGAIGGMIAAILEWLWRDTE